MHSTVVCMLFFFKQKTTYEMRISDWSSDVFSSDLRIHHEGRRVLRPWNDIDLLTLELADHRLHAAAAHADAGADRVDGAVVRDDGNLGAADRKSTRLNSSH